ncbi:MAG: sigma-70 family RNA polymerase sigma factor [Bacteroides sp.]|nr:sigma-70 family RNA polymerase sigma factor [Bacteroides sp.]
MIADVLTTTFITLRAKLHNMAAGIAGPEEAEDVIHDAFCRLWSSHRLVEDEMQAVKLSYTAVRNSAIDSLRRSQTRRTVSLDDSLSVAERDDSDAEAAEQRETYEAVIRLSRKALNQRQFEVFELHDIKGMGYQDVAETLGMTQENVRVTLSRARKIIRDLYRKNNES